MTEVEKNLGNSDRDKGITTVLCVIGFIAIAGLHRFYVGKIGTGILWLITGGFFLIGTIVDLVKICRNTFTDKNKKVIS